MIKNDTKNTPRNAFNRVYTIYSLNFIRYIKMNASNIIRQLDFDTQIDNLAHFDLIIHKVEVMGVPTEEILQRAMRNSRFSFLLSW